MLDVKTTNIKISLHEDLRFEKTEEDKLADIAILKLCINPNETLTTDNGDGTYTHIHNLKTK